MMDIDTRVLTYDLVGHDGYMEITEDGTGDWVYIAEHERLVYKLQNRITYLENCLYDATRMLTGD